MISKEPELICITCGRASHKLSKHAPKIFLSQTKMDAPVLLTGHFLDDLVLPYIAV